MRSLKPLLFLPVAFMLGGCPSVEPTGTSTQVVSHNYAPVLMSRDQLEASIEFQTETRTPANAGKIMIFEDYFFVNEMYEGFHVYDISDMTAPKPLGFLRVPGAIDIAASNGYFYVDNAVDLVTLTFDNNQVVEVDRQREALQEMSVPQGGVAIVPKDAPADAIIVGWNIQ